MTREEIIRNLKYTMKKHKNDTVNTFETNISLMCKDILDYLNQQPCDDAVSRKAVDELSKELVTTTRDKADSLCNFWEGLQKLPPVTPQQKYGKWILADEQNKEDVENNNYRFICSECQCSDIHAKGAIVPYCWKCGAKMQESEDKI